MNTWPRITINVDGIYQDNAELQRTWLLDKQPTFERKICEN